MKLYDIEDDGLESITKISDLDNFFDVYVDKKNKYVFNLNETIYIAVKKHRLKRYICKHESHWSLLSYQIYGSTRLAWLLMKLNNVTAKNVFELKEAGDVVYYLEQGAMDSILETINEY